MGSIVRLADKRIFVAGHDGLVGSALVRRLAQEGCEILAVGHADLDLRRQSYVEDWLADARPDIVFLAAATVGGIRANDTRPADFLYDNLAIAINLIHAAHRLGVGKLVNLGSACIYPRLADQPMAEDAMLTGPLEPTNQWYAVAKIAAIKLCDAYRRQHGCDFISAMPANIYGQGDNFDLDEGHVLPALIGRIHEAKLAEAPEVVVWGTGSPRREFLHIDDAADGIVFLTQRYSGEGPINIGTGEEVSIGELAKLIADRIGYRGTLVFDETKPDGMPRKILDSARIQELGWRARVSLADGIDRTYRWYCGEIDQGRPPRGVSSDTAAGATGPTMPETTAPRSPPANR